jgi:hypothetical protein
LGVLTFISVSFSAVHQMADDDADELASWNTSVEDGPFATSTAAVAAEATTSSPASSSATKLTAEIAVEIFRAGGPDAKRSGLSKVLAERYGVTMKAIRDVWNLRTWTDVTRPFWSLEGRAETSPREEMPKGMAGAAEVAAASLAREHEASCHGAGRFAVLLPGQVFAEKTLTDAVPTERTESSCFNFNADFDAVSGLLRSVPDNQGVHWSGTGLPVTQSAASPAPVASWSQGAAFTGLETATEADEPNLTHDDAGGTFLDGWAIPRIQWLTPPDVELFGHGDATAEVSAIMRTHT